MLGSSSPLGVQQVQRELTVCPSAKTKHLGLYWGRGWGGLRMVVGDCTRLPFSREKKFQSRDIALAAQ